MDLLRSRAAHPQAPLDDEAGVGSNEPEEVALLADAVGNVLLVVLATLTPEERVAFVLHDMFAVPFERIAPMVERTPATRRSWPAAPDTRSAAPRHRTSPANGNWSPRSWPPPGPPTSRRSTASRAWSSPSMGSCGWRSPSGRWPDASPPTR
jgi:hypothetical protein